MKRVWVFGFLVGCGTIEAKNPDAKVGTDATGIDSPANPDAAGPRCDPSKPFGVPAKLANVNSTMDDITPFVTADELELWFASNRTGSQGLDIYMASRASKDADFGMPMKAAGVNTAGDDTRPTLTGDGLHMYIQYKASANAKYKITHAIRNSTMIGFSTPVEESVLSSTADDDAQSVLPDHSAIYFLSGRTGGFLIYRAPRVNNAFQTPMLADAVDLNSYGDDYPTIEAGEKTIYFLSGRPGSAGTDNWKATRPSTVQAFAAATNVSELNAVEGYYINAVTADDCIAYLSGPGNGQDLFVAKKPL